MKPFFFISLLLLFCFSSCQKDVTALTQAQLTAHKMEKELGIQENTTSSNYNVTVYNLSTYDIILMNATSFRIDSNGYLTVYDGSGSRNFNLGQLKYFESDGNNLVLYFWWLPFESDISYFIPYCCDIWRNLNSKI